MHALQPAFPVDGLQEMYPSRPPHSNQIVDNDVKASDTFSWPPPPPLKSDDFNETVPAGWDENLTHALSEFSPPGTLSPRGLTSIPGSATKAKVSPPPVPEAKNSTFPSPAPETSKGKRRATNNRNSVESESPVGPSSPNLRVLRPRPGTKAPGYSKRKSKDKTLPSESPRKRSKPEAHENDTADNSSNRKAKEKAVPAEAPHKPKVDDHEKETSVEPDFPPLRRFSRGEASNKRPAHSALPVPEFDHKKLRKAIEAGSTMVQMACLGCIAFNKECIPNKTGTKCHSCQHSMCSHSLPVDQIHDRIQMAAEITHFANSHAVLIAQAQAVANIAPQRLRESSNFLAFTVRSMIAFYGLKNFARLWKILKPYRKMFMNFLIFETKKSRDGFEADRSLDDATRCRFGEALFSEEDDGCLGGRD
ncbi:hypothetical protein K438DRAFT_1935346 [Mycena galopus ATCC 62051]|nr:hypothetical protein K438DRAFT_1935346 [Mycena galopus ATCC 62051]